MMRRLLAIALALVLPCRLCARADSDSAPYAAMRTLQVLQEQVAHGNATAQTAQPQLMAHIADGFLGRRPCGVAGAAQRAGRGPVPAQRRPARASSAPSSNGRTFPPEIDRLLKGALAYGEGQDEIARQLLGSVDPQTPADRPWARIWRWCRPPCSATRTPQRRSSSSTSSRLLAPGTLIEEAALRREVFLLIDKGRVDKAMLLSRQYFRRYRTSSYADNFRQRFADAAIRMAVAGNTKQLSQLDSVLNELPASETRAFYLLVARTALFDGKTLGARFAAKKAVALAPKGSAEETRAKLYLAASQVITEEPERRAVRSGGARSRPN